jgi:AraC-like DNA-binding protein
MASISAPRTASRSEGGWPEPFELDLKYLARQVFPGSLSPGGQSPSDDLVPDWELIWIIEGEWMLRKGDTIELIHPYSVFLNRPGERVQYIPVDDAPLVMGVAILYSLSDQNLPAFRQADRDDITIGLLEHALFLDAERPPGWERALERSLTHALWVYATGASGHLSTAEEFTAPIMRVIGSLRYEWQSGPLRAPALDRLAAFAGVTRVQLCRLFQTELGHGPVETLRLIRIHDAAGLLRSGFGRTEAARRTGFETERHFSQVFRTVVGMTPTEFRADGSARYDLPSAVRRFRSHLFRPRRLA